MCGILAIKNNKALLAEGGGRAVPLWRNGMTWIQKSVSSSDSPIRTELSKRTPHSHMGAALWPSQFLVRALCKESPECFYSKATRKLHRTMLTDIWKDVLHTIAVHLSWLLQDHVSKDIAQTPAQPNAAAWK